MTQENMLPIALQEKLADFARSGDSLVVMTGAGVSAESGIPTFRGPDGYWTVGSKVYQPQEIATNAMLRKKPEDVWMWFLYRRGVCQAAQPNPGHFAIAEMEHLFGDRFTLLTQNVDGLHIRAGNSLERTYHVHGDLTFMRCLEECTTELFPLPEAMPPKERGGRLTLEEWAMLKCPRCGAITRPHVLLWDEFYNEEHFRFKSSLIAATEAKLLIVVGTTGATTLPNQAVRYFFSSGGLMVDLNIEYNIFSQVAEENGGYFIKSGSGTALPQMVAAFKRGLEAG